MLVHGCNHLVKDGRVIVIEWQPLELAPQVPIASMQYSDHTAPLPTEPKWLSPVCNGNQASSFCRLWLAEPCYWPGLPTERGRGTPGPPPAPPGGKSPGPKTDSHPPPPPVRRCG